MVLSILLAAAAAAAATQRKDPDRFSKLWCRYAFGTFEDGTVQYKIKWKGLDDDHATWEPPAHLQHAQQAVAEYEATHKECA